MRLQTIVHGLLFVAVAQLLLALGILLEDRDVTAVARQVGFSSFCVVMAVNGAYGLRLLRNNLQQESAWVRWLVTVATPRTLVALSAITALFWAIPAYVAVVEKHGGFRITINVLPCVFAVCATVGYVLAARRDSRD